MTENQKTDLPNPIDTLRELLTDMAEEVREVVERIEAGPHLTKGHYGEYMALLSAIDDPDGQMKRKIIMASALIMAGADREGVADAFRLTMGS